MTEATYIVKTESFEGPFELLLSLVQKRKLFINDISLAEVTNDYLERVRELTNIPLWNRAHFISVASILILIKSKSLLPGIQLEKDEDREISELQLRLRKYEAVKGILQGLKLSWMKEVSIPGKPYKIKTQEFSPGATLSRKALEEHIKYVLNNLPEKEPELPEHVVEKVMSIEEMIENMVDRIQESVQTSFRSLSKNASQNERTQKVHTIVGFLAVLELVRQGILEAVQDDSFNDIMIHKV